MKKTKRNKMKGLGNWVMLLPLDTEYKSKGVILDIKKFRFATAIVVTSGITDIKEGQKVLFDTINSHNVMIDGTKYIITLAQNIAVIL